MSFDAKYHFKQNNTVVIEHIHNGTIRADPNTNDACSDGGRGELAQWEVKLLGDDKVRFKNVSTGKYLRLRNNDVDVDGGEGPATIFKVHVVNGPNVVKLESNKFDGKYIAVRPNGKVRGGGGKKMCKLTLYRNAGGGGGGGGGQQALAQAQADAQANAQAAALAQAQAQAEAQAQALAQAQAEAAANAQIAAQAQAEAQAAAAQAAAAAQEAQAAEDEKNAPLDLDEDGEAVKAWLVTIGHDGYLSNFIEAGYGKMETCSMITEDDLEEMGVKAGHRKEIMLAARAAPFLNHWVGLRCQHKKRFLAADKGQNEEVELDDKASEKDGRWFIEQSPNGNNLIRLKSTYDTYLKMKAKQDEHLATVKGDKIDGKCDLQILPCTGDNKKKNLVRIWCPRNANFMTYDDNILKDRVNSHEESFDKDVVPKQQWEIIIKE